MKSYINVAIWSIFLGTWISASLISFTKGKNAFYLSAGNKKCWYDMGLKTFKEELIEASQKLKKAEEKSTILNKNLLKTPHKNLKNFINNENDGLENYCEKTFFYLMEKLEKIFEDENVEKYDKEYYENYSRLTNKLKEEILNKLEPRWNRYNDLNYDKVVRWQR